MSARVYDLQQFLKQEVRVFGKVKNVTKADFSELCLDMGGSKFAKISFRDPQTQMKQGDIVEITGTVAEDGSGLVYSHVPTHFDSLDLETYAAQMSKVVSNSNVTSIKL